MTKILYCFRETVPLTSLKIIFSSFFGRSRPNGSLPIVEHNQQQQQHARPYQADQGCGGPRPHRVPRPLHRDQAGGSGQALRLQEVSLDPRPQGEREQIWKNNSNKKLRDNL